jgi:hypothetical protein
LEPTVTHVAAIQGLITSKMKLKHQQHKVTSYDVAEINCHIMNKHISTLTTELLSTHLLHIAQLIIDSSLILYYGLV